MAPDCNNVQEFKDKIKESIQKEYEKKSEDMFNSAVIDQFIKLVDPILPSSMFNSYLANIVNEAALLAARKRKRSIDNDDFEEAKDKVMMGIQRKSMVLSEEEKEVTAVSYTHLTLPTKA